MKVLLIDLDWSSDIDINAGRGLFNKSQNGHLQEFLVKNRTLFPTAYTTVIEIQQVIVEKEDWEQVM